MSETRHNDLSLSHFFDYGIHEPTGTLYWGDDNEGIDDTFAERALKGLHLLRNRSAVKIMLSSFGGSLFAAEAIYDAIAALPGWVAIQTLGPVMSAAAVILQAGDLRSMAPNSLMMIHYGYESIYQEPSVSAQRWMGRAKLAGDWMAGALHRRIVQRHPEFKLSKVKRLLEHDTYYSAQEAVDIGLADQVGVVY